MNLPLIRLIKNRKLLLFLPAVLLPVIFGAASCEFQEATYNDWPMYKYNPERTGSADIYNFDTINQLWVHDFEAFEEGGGSRVSLAISSGAVLIPTRHYISCIDSDKGILLWRRYIGENFSSPVIYQGRVIISSSRIVYAFNLSDGVTIWVKNMEKDENINPGVSVPAAYDGNIYYGFRARDDSEGYLFCIDAGDGSTKWQYTVSGPVRTSPVVKDDRVYFGSDNGDFYCLDAHDGSYIWQYRTGDVIRSSPAIHDEQVFFGCNNKYVYSLDINTGSLMWRSQTEDINNATPTAARGKVIISSNDRYLHCFDDRNGRFIWKYNVGDLSYTSPTVCGNKVLLGLEDEIICLNIDSGRPIFQKKLIDSGASTPLSIFDGRLYFRTTSYLFCFTLD